MAHHNHHQNRNQQQNARHRRLSQKDQLKASESLLLQEIAFETRHLRARLSGKELLFALLSSKYRHEMMRAKMRRIERLERLQAQLAALRDQIALFC